MTTLLVSPQYVTVPGWISLLVNGLKPFYVGNRHETIRQRSCDGICTETLTEHIKIGKFDEDKNSEMFCFFRTCGVRRIIDFYSHSS